MTPSIGVPSPCINVCRIHAATGWCEGCLRSLDEIAQWSRMADADKAAVWQRLTDRKVVWAQRAGSAATKEGP